MSTLGISSQPYINKVYFKGKKIFVLLADGREIGVPLDWFPRLVKASRVERSHYKIFLKGTAIEFPDIDEHISLESLLTDNPDNWLVFNRSKN